MKYTQPILFAAMIAVGSAVQAALPPLAQSMTEIDALVKDKQFYNLLGSERFITSIALSNEGYTVTTWPFCIVDVKKIMQLSADGSVAVGPVKFSFQFPEALPPECHVD